MTLKEGLVKKYFEIGDIVHCDQDDSDNTHYKIVSYQNSSLVMLRRNSGVWEDNPVSGNSWLEYRWSLVEKNKNNMNLKETVLLALTKEPFKSLRRAKITNGDDMLTDEGRELFLNWLFRESVNKFVADEAIKATLDETNKKCKEE